MKKAFICLLLALLVLPTWSAGAASLSGRLAGRILLAVEAKGEAWYVNPVNGERAYLGRPADAFNLMRALGLGISEADYGRFRNSAPRRLAGLILVRAQAKGEAYYVNPATLRLHFLGRPADAFAVMREQGLGIADKDLSAIPVDARYENLTNVQEQLQIFVETTLLQAGQTARIANLSLADGLYSFRVEISGGLTVESYASKDLTLMFPQAMDLNTSIPDLKARIKALVEDQFSLGGQSAWIGDLADEGAYYLFAVRLSGRQDDIVSYINKAGTKFFPTAIEMGAEDSDNAGKTGTDSTGLSPAKSVRPQVELFVMSRCPYALQMEKGLLPVQTVLKDRIDLTVKFLDYVMHGSEETEENMRQYCIQSEQPARYFDYLGCYVGAGDSAACRATAAVDEAALTACVEGIDQQYNLRAGTTGASASQFPAFPLDQTDVKKYGITGSPTLVVNGQTVSVGRDSVSLLNVICDAFTVKPAECATTLSASAPKPGFGYGDGGTTSGECAGL